MKERQSRHREEEEEEGICDESDKWFLKENRNITEHSHGAQERNISPRLQDGV